MTESLIAPTPDTRGTADDAAPQIPVATGRVPRRGLDLSRARRAESALLQICP